ASAARTFPPRSGGKVTAFFQAVGKVLRLFRQPERRWQFNLPAALFSSSFYKGLGSVVCFCPLWGREPQKN
ncbi:MAG: hypothetical protein KHX40_08535, partial [Oscillospiraceae bacterium]|nr:hypothetical protein [Oscillospiraceae bacterium]